MLGISTSFFAFHGLDIHSSVARARELGFEAVELGAAHKFEKDVFKTLKEIKRDFGDLQFTLHGFFPPQPTPFWFNACEGLSARNRKLLEALFKAAELMDASVASIHVGSFDKLGYDAGNVRNGMVWEVNEGRLEEGRALRGLKEVVAFSLPEAEAAGFKFALENIPPVVCRPALDSPAEFKAFLDGFPGLGFLLDVGHAMMANHLEGFLSLKEKIVEIHLHDSDGKIDHIPLGKGKLDLGSLKTLPELKGLPLVMEYGGRTSEKEMLEAKRVADAFLLTL